MLSIYRIAAVPLLAFAVSTTTNLPCRNPKDFDATPV
jgi:hypothetical protein